MADKPDLNDPNQRFSRAEAMKIVARSSHEEKLKKDVAPEDQAGVAAALNAADPDAEPVTPAAAPAPEANLDAAAQVASQTETPKVLAGDVLAMFKVKIKVNGEEREVPLADVVASAQKNEAADAYLANAKEQARVILEGARAAVPATPAEPAPQPVATAPATATPAVDGEKVKTAMDLLFTGNTDEAAKTLVAALSVPQATPAAPSIDYDQVVSTLDSRMVVRSALRQFAKDFPQVYQDPVARTVADRFLSEATGGKPLEVFSEDDIGKILHGTGERVLEWTRALGGVPANGSKATTRDDKVAKKEGIDELPAAATRAAVNVPQPKTTSQTIAEMAAARGQNRGLVAPT